MRQAHARCCREGSCFIEIQGPSVGLQTPTSAASPPRQILILRSSYSRHPFGIRTTSAHRICSSSQYECRVHVNTASIAERTPATSFFGWSLTSPLSTFLKHQKACKYRASILVGGVWQSKPRHRAGTAGGEWTWHWLFRPSAKSESPAYRTDIRSHRPVASNRRAYGSQHPRR